MGIAKYLISKFVVYKISSKREEIQEDWRY